MPAYWDCRFKGDIKDQEEALRVSTTVYVGNLSYYVTEDQLCELFGRVGEVKRVKTPCGFCFVIFYTHFEATDAIRFLNGTTLGGRPIRVDLDTGFEEGRQYGRGMHGGQVRDEYRDKYDPNRGGFGQMVNMTGNTNNAC
ncbi:unnamed protein product [Heligmosomoides polygyrus]|uniref:Nuclear cap-binding protein subunit 2 n=1 Tax=Heligmosomoides polygyrus TaxID=6339 RepID=A0A183GQ32_HELPZ|nr:unnamed protein product [Heligmosomoides polygyrus]